MSLSNDYSQLKDKYASAEAFAAVLPPLTLDEANVYVTNDHKDILVNLISINTANTHSKAINHYKKKFVIETNKIFQDEDANDEYKHDLKQVAYPLSVLLISLENQEYDKVSEQVKSLNENIQKGLKNKRITKHENGYNIAAMIGLIALSIATISIALTVPMSGAVALSLLLIGIIAGVTAVFPAIDAYVKSRSFFIPKPAGFKEANQTANAVRFATLLKG